MRLGGELRHISILFSDIRKFTTFSENLSPQALTQLLNDYLTPMTNIIMQSNGTVDKYIGDAIMAFWGAPLDLPEHPQVAVESAKRMIQTLRKLSPSWIKKGYPPIDIGIGVHSDQVVVGNVGSLQRFAYSAVGDGVNLTSRLEGLTKYYRVNILVSEQTIVCCKETIDSTFREVDLVLVVGRKEPVRIFEIMVHDPAEKHLFLDHVRDFAQALAFYRYGNFADARHDFLALAARTLQDYRDELSEMFAARCQDFLDASVKDRWDGIWLMKDK